MFPIKQRGISLLVKLGYMVYDLLPLTSALKVAETKFDESVMIYLEFHHFIVNLNFLQFIIFLYIIIKQLLNMSSLPLSKFTQSDKLMLFSVARYNLTLKYDYWINMLLCIFILMIVVLIRYLQKQRQYQEASTRQINKFSHLVFCRDWNV